MNEKTFDKILDAIYRPLYDMYRKGAFDFADIDEWVESEKKMFKRNEWELLATIKWHNKQKKMTAKHKKAREKLINACIQEITNDVKDKEFTYIAAFLEKIPNSILLDYLPLYECYNDARKYFEK